MGFKPMAALPSSLTTAGRGQADPARGSPRSDRRVYRHLYCVNALNVWVLTGCQPGAIIPDAEEAGMRANGIAQASRDQHPTGRRRGDLASSPASSLSQKRRCLTSSPSGRGLR